MRQSLTDIAVPTYWDLPWQVTSPRISVGPYRIDTDDVLGCMTTAVSQRQTRGKLLTLCLFLAWALIILVAVLGFGWQTRFLLAAIVLAVIGIITGLETMRAGPQLHWRLDIALRGGRRISFATTNKADAEALSRRLTAIANANR